MLFCLLSSALVFGRCSACGGSMFRFGAWGAAFELSIQEPQVPPLVVGLWVSNSRMAHLDFEAGETSKALLIRPR